MPVPETGTHCWLMQTRCVEEEFEEEVWEEEEFEEEVWEEEFEEEVWEEEFEEELLALEEMELVEGLLAFEVEEEVKELLLEEFTLLRELETVLLTALMLLPLDPDELWLVPNEEMLLADVPLLAVEPWLAADDGQLSTV